MTGTAQHPAASRRLPAAALPGDGLPGDGQPVELTGHLGNVVRHVNRCGHTWAEADLLVDGAQAVAVQVFPQLYQRVGVLVSDGELVTVSGRVDRRDADVFVVLAELTRPEPARPDASDSRVSRAVTVDVVGIVVHTLHLDLDDPAWQWLAELPEHQRPAALAEEANTTGGALEQLLTPDTLDGAWREAVIGTASIQVQPDHAPARPATGSTADAGPSGAGGSR